jgi:hypothetical protein
MAILAIDGFDLYNGTSLNTGLQSKWGIARTDQYTTSLIAGRFGGQAVSFSPTINVSGAGLNRSFAAASAGSLGFAFKTNVTGAASAAIFAMTLSGTAIFNLATQTGGALAAYKGAGTQMGVTSAMGVILANTWHYAEIEWAISATVGVFNVWVDGVKVIANTGLNNNAAGANVDTIAIQCSSNGTTTIVDDFYYTTGAATRLGESRVETLRPAADTATKNWTPNSGTTNFSRVNELVCDGDTSFVSATAVATADLYTVGALSSTPANIYAVQLTAFSYKTDATTRAINLVAKSGATSSPGGNLPLPASYAKFERVLEIDPNTGASWTAAAVNALQIGPNVAV